VKGQSKYSIIKDGKKITTGESFSIEILFKSRTCDELVKEVKDEIELLHSLNHPSVMKICAFYNEIRYFYIITNLFGGEELFVIIAKKNKWSENDARHVCRILLDAIRYCHEKCIVHRNIKPEVLINVDGVHSNKIKLVGFRYAKRSCTYLTTRYGNNSVWSAPEIVSGDPYDKKVDMWSMGIICYVILAGYLPFEDFSLNRIRNRIKLGRFSFHDEYWCNVSPGAKDFVQKLLNPNPCQRWNANQALQHEWFRQDNQVLEERNLDKFLTNIRTFNYCARKQEKTLI